MTLMDQKVIAQYVERDPRQIHIEQTSCLVAPIACESFIAPSKDVCEIQDSKLEQIERKNAPTTCVSSNYYVRLVRRLILCHFVDLFRLGGIKPTIVGTVVARRKRRMEGGNAICAHQVQECLSGINQDAPPGKNRNRNDTDVLVSREGVLVPALCLFHILERGQNERSAPFANAPRHAILAITQEGAH
jgi:hypothetical protein